MNHSIVLYIAVAIQFATKIIAVKYRTETLIVSNFLNYLLFCLGVFHLSIV